MIYVPTRYSKFPSKGSKGVYWSREFLNVLHYTLMIVHFFPNLPQTIKVQQKHVQCSFAKVSLAPAHFSHPSDRLVTVWRGKQIFFVGGHNSFLNVVNLWSLRSDSYTMHAEWTHCSEIASLAAALFFEIYSFMDTYG